MKKKLNLIGNAIINLKAVKLKNPSEYELCIYEGVLFTLEEILRINKSSSNFRQRVLKNSISKYKFSVRLRRAFKKLGVETVGDIVKYGPETYLRSLNFGCSTFVELYLFLWENNLNFKPYKKAESEV